MGLDIYRCKAVDHETEHYIYIDEESSKNEIACFEHFSKYIKQRTETAYDWESTFKSWGVDYTTLEYDGSSYGMDYSYHTFIDTSGNVMKIMEQDVITKEVILDVVYYEEEYIQRRQMKKLFYSNYLAGCWYEAESNIPKEDGILYAYTQELVDRAKTLSDLEAPINNVELKDDEFLYFSA